MYTFSLAKLFLTVTTVCVAFGMYQVGKYQGRGIGFVENQKQIEIYIRTAASDDLTWTTLQQTIKEQKDGLPPSLVTTFPMWNIKLDHYWFAETCLTLFVVYLCVKTCLTTK